VPEKYQGVFKLLDRDHDGALTEEELSGVFSLWTLLSR
jgi:Ca2+-binding EF-hand superfamily protein